MDEATRLQAATLDETRALVQVRRQPGDWLLARYELDKITGMQWSRVAGGMHRRSQLHVYGYVWCNEKVDGRVAHSCRHGPPPHKIKICVTKKYNEKIWPEILRVVGPKPPTRRQARVARKKLSSA